MKFFIDNNLSIQMARGMEGFGEEVMHLQDEFPQGTPDEQWLQYVGDNDLILVTRDREIRRRPAELKALKDHKVGVFFLGGKNRGRCELIQQLVRNWPRMKAVAAKARKPFAFVVPPSGGKFRDVPL